MRINFTVKVKKGGKGITPEKKIMKMPFIG
jgi:hypothetical protein